MIEVSRAQRRGEIFTRCGCIIVLHLKLLAKERQQEVKNSIRRRQKSRFPQVEIEVWCL
jgi:hypothetical protein